MNPIQPTDRTRVRRLPQRGTHDRQTIYDILDQALVAHVGFVDTSQPYVLPMAFVRFGDSIFLHGSTRARMLEQISAGDPVCVTATLLDGLVLARSAFHHSMNYRSVAVLGSGRAVEDRDRALTALEALTEKLTPGRWAEIRLPTDQEMKATRVVEIPIEEASAKIRTGPPLDDEDDMALAVWAGCVPIVRSYGEPEADPTLERSIPLPAHVTALTATRP
jgi:nitroimidazol reductase NimA-like FMN-containing flavoprotein (pyridoxamine 5'-phosphate oxidase superfamily)